MIILILLALIVVAATVFVLWILSLKVQYTTNNGGEIAAKVLKSHNVKFIFTLIGGHIAPILVESEKLGTYHTFLNNIILLIIFKIKNRNKNS